MLSCSGEEGATAYARRRLVVFPGDVVVASALARRISGSPGLYIDSPAGTVRAVQLVDSDSLQLHEVRAVAGEGTGPLDVAVIFGVRGSRVGAGAFSRPRIRIERSQVGALRTLVAASVSLGNNTVAVDTAVCRAGIGSVSWSSADRAVEITLEQALVPLLSGAGLGLLPLVTVSGAGGPPAIWQARVVGDRIRVTGFGLSGEPVEPSASLNPHSFSIEVKI